MEEINELKFKELLTSTEISEYINLIVNFDDETSVNLNEITTSNIFKNCKFIGKSLTFINLSHDDNSELIHFFSFDNCEFINDVFFEHCFVKELRFTNINKSIKKLHLAPKKIGDLTFYCSEPSCEKNSNDINIIIDNCEILYSLDLFNLKSTGNLFITSSTVNYFKIHKSIFKRFQVDNCNFKNDFQFTHNFIENSYIYKNQFCKTNFSDTDFGLEAEFSFNDFNGTALFENLKNENRTTVKFDSCNFTKYTYFNNSTLYYLRIDTSKFQEFTSFQELELNSIFLDRTIFEKLVFFDDIKIFNLAKCNKRTIRNIKQQLLKSENKIDYDSFRVHELNSYKEELRENLKLKSNINRKNIRRDLMILNVNTFYSNNGTDWVKAIKRTFFVAILFYSIFFAITNYQKEIDLFNFYSYNDFIIGLFRYFLITDFHNPLEKNREYLQDALQWIPFVIGKVLITIGIYEILISFRKFKK